MSGPGSAAPSLAAKTLHQLVPQAEIQVVPNAGHAPFLDDASTFN